MGGAFSKHVSKIDACSVLRRILKEIETKWKV
jgi:hypothetical protein